MTRILLLLGVSLLSFQCSGASQTPAIPATPPAETRATLAGPLCDGMRCQCSDNPQEIGIPEEGLKRFRVELGPTESLLWATIDGHVLHKGIERASACFYLDLRQGEHAISLRATGEAGFGAGLKIMELGGQSGEGETMVGPYLYPSFDFNCGAPGLCDMQSLRDWRNSIKHVSAGKHAPCGSVRILGIDWTTGRMPDNLHPADFLLEATMKVYKFLPHHPPGTEECSKQEE